MGCRPQRPSTEIAAVGAGIPRWHRCTALTRRRRSSMCMAGAAALIKLRQRRRPRQHPQRRRRLQIRRTRITQFLARLRSHARAMDRVARSCLA
jgi:hypothetical protein